MPLTMNIDSMDRAELMQHLRSLVEEAKRYPADNVHRQKALTKVIRLLPNLLWKERSPHYNDALQQTFEYFCRHVDRYDPNRGNVVTWLDSYLRWRLIDFSQLAKEVPFSQFSYHNDDGDSPFADIPDLADRTPLSILDCVQEWVETDPTGDLKSLHIKKHPHVTAQLLILRRLPPETSWGTLSKTLGIKIPTLSTFYQRHCVPRLREFGKVQGYL